MYRGCVCVCVYCQPYLSNPRYVVQHTYSRDAQNFASQKDKRRQGAGDGITCIIYTCTRKHGVYLSYVTLRTIFPSQVTINKEERHKLRKHSYTKKKKKEKKTRKTKGIRKNKKE